MLSESNGEGRSGLTAREKRRIKFEQNSPNWSTGSLVDALERFAPNTEGVVSSDGVKTRYMNTATNIEIIADNENPYFRIRDHNRHQYLTLSGEIPSGPANGCFGKAASNYEKQVTYILNR